MSTEENSATTMSTKEKMKKAVKEYGSTVIVFHVTISLFSLGACYLLISRYVVNHVHIIMNTISVPNIYYFYNIK